jgi:hypothetical protein
MKDRSVKQVMLRGGARGGGRQMKRVKKVNT